MPGSLPQRPRRRVAPRFAPLVLAIVALLLGYDPFGARIASAQSRSRAKGGRSVEEAAREIDRKLEEAWEESFVERSPDLDDGLFLRRLSLDLRGVIPLADEVIRYASDPDPNKASKWAGWFLRSPDYADFFAERWEHILLGRTGGTDGLDREGFRAWLRQAFLTGKPWDEFARELLTTTGTPKDDPASNLFIRFAGANREETAKDVSARIARVFLGTRIECAQCHDHPYMDLKREQFWGLAAFFARTDLRRRVDRAGGQTDLLAVIDLDEGEMRMPPMKEGEEAQPIPPIFFGDKYLASLPKAESAARASEPSRERDSRSPSSSARGSRRASSSAASRREELVEWLTRKDNPYFARALVNRMWAHFLGKGFFNPIDDYTVEANVAFPDLLDFIARDLIESGWDVRRLAQVIVSTRAYRQRALRGVPGGIAQGESHDLFASIPIRPIEAEVLARSVLRATGLEEPQPERNAQRVRRYIDQAKAEFVRRFGVDETERRDEFQGTVLQVLLLFNGEYTEGAAPADRTFQTSYERVAPGSLGVVLHGVRPDQRIDRLFLATLSRRPTSHERLALEQHVASARTEEEWERALRDIQWALLNSAEFLHTP